MKFEKRRFALWFLLTVLAIGLSPTFPALDVWVNPRHLQRYLNGQLIGGTVFAMSYTVYGQGEDGVAVDSATCDGIGNSAANGNNPIAGDRNALHK